MSRNLDILRAMAVLYVFICHIGLMFLPHSQRPYFEGAGRFGVILFFVHTSLVLMQSLESLGPGTHGWVRRFYVRRAFRIYPLSIAAIVITLVFKIPAAPWLPDEVVHSTTAAIANFLLVQNILREPPIIATLWSLPIEVQMYIVLPVIFLFLQRRRWGWWMAGMLAGAALAAVAVFRLTHHLNIFAFTGCFLAGPLAYKLRKRITPTLRSFWWIPAVLLATLGGVWFREVIAVEWLLCLAVALTFPHVADAPKGPLTRACHEIAKYSYGIYLFHLPAIWLAFQFTDISPVLQLLICIGGTGAAAVISFHVLEDPLTDVGKKLAKKMARRREPRMIPADVVST